MIREKQQKSEIIGIFPIDVIDLTGPNGNAFALIAYAKKLAKQLGYSAEDVDELKKEMTSGDYENLLQVFDDHFGSLIILER